MAIKTDNDLPELVPFDDRLPSREGLFRRSEEMPDDQFALLAAEWAEGETDADRLSEIESMFAASPEKRFLAEDFKRLRLVAGNEKLAGLEALMKAPARNSNLKRFTYAVLASAAVVLAFLALSPLLRSTVSQSSPANLPEVAATRPDQKPVAATISAQKPDAATMSAQKPDVSPGSKMGRATIATGTAVSGSHITESRAAEGLTAGTRAAGGQAAGTVAAHGSEKLQANAGLPLRIQPLDLSLSHEPEAVRLIAGADIGTTELKHVEMMPVGLIIRSQPREANWMMRGITALTKTITGKDKPVDGYMVAGACVKGINSVLGWDMDLERVMSADGNTLAVNFSSSLLSFSSPAKKSTYEP